jgi:hypothetical protein
MAPMKGSAMSRIVLDAEAGQISAELARPGIPPHARVHALVEVTSGKGLDWLAARNLNSIPTPT